MSSNTSIEWTDATWNPVRGCSRVSSGCIHCYAEGIAARFSGEGLPYQGLARFVDAPGGREARWTGKVRLVPEALDEPLRWRKPQRIFVNSMSDLFHDGLADAEIATVFAVMAKAPQHTFQVLTKRPTRMLSLLSDPFFLALVTIASGEMRFVFPLPNVWLGVSVEDQTTADERIPLLLQTPAAVRFLSYEPALEPVGFTRYLWRRLDWLIAGGESGTRARPCELSWLLSARDQCAAAGVAFFCKQLGSWPVVDRQEAERVAAAGGRIEWDDSGERVSARLLLHHRHGGDPAEWPEDLRVREFPEARG